MLGSLGIIFLVALVFAGVMKKLKMPSLIGMIITGIIIGPYGLDLIDESLLSLSTDLRKIALIIILVRAGLGLDFKQIKQIGKGAGLLTIIPALFEMVIITIIAYLIFDFSLISSIILATVISAVSPAVVVPRMLDLIERGEKKIPQLVIATSSIEDVFVISIFSIIISIATTDSFKAASILFIILGIILGIVTGVICASIIIKIFRKFQIVDGAKVLTLLSVSFLLITVESKFSYFSSLLAIMSMAIIVGQLSPTSKTLQPKFKELWIGAEIILFVIVGAGLDITSATSDILPALLIIAFGLLFRSVGVLFSLRKSKLSKNELKFIIISFFPKATVQAAIAPIALSLGLSNGNAILNIAVIAILITAPLGAFLIDKYKETLLTKETL